MPVPFLENLSLAKLLSPTSVDEFSGLNWEWMPLIVHRHQRDYYGDLFSIAEFDDAITRQPGYVKVANETTQKRGSYNAGSVRGLEGILADMREGTTLVLDQLHEHDPKLGLLARILGAEIGHRLQTNLYLTPSNGRGFSPHWDNHDVFILQVVGSKHWKIEKQRRIHPTRHDFMGEDGRELRGELYSFTLEQGDLAYIPSGFVHAAECGAEPSLHITLGITAMTYEDLLTAAVKVAAKTMPELRNYLPMGFMTGLDERMLLSTSSTLKEMSDPKFMKLVLAEFRNDWVTKFPLDVSGHIAGFFGGVPLSLDDNIGPRPGTMLQVHPDPSGVRVHFGARTIVFAPQFEAALRYAIRHTCTPKDFPGEIEDVERLALAERMLDEGLLVRQSTSQA